MTHQTMSDRTDRATARPTHGANTDTPFTRPEKVRAVPLEELAEAFAEFNRGTRRARWCGRGTTSARRVCVDCMGVEARQGDAIDPAMALRGGRWVLDPVRRVQVWEPAA